MSEPLKIAGLIAVSAATLSIVLFGVLTIENQEERKFVNGNLKWIDWQADFENDPPPSPIFNTLDNESCKETIQSAYKEANKSYDAYYNNRQKLDDSLQAILDGQAKKNIELVDNTEFLKWITSDWDQTWEAKNNPDAEEPELDYKMRETFLSAPNGNKV